MNHSKKTIFSWIPSRVRIQENDKADSLTKAAFNKVPDKKMKNTLYWPQIENQANNYIEMATIMEENFPQQALLSTAHFKKKEAGF